MVLIRTLLTKMLQIVLPMAQVKQMFSLILFQMAQRQIQLQLQLLLVGLIMKLLL